MKDNGAVSYSLPINGSYAIPQGYHNGQGKVTQSITTMNGSTVNPSTSTVTIGTDKKYINGNFTIPAFSLPSASVIKKGTTITIYGKSVTGTFEGWVPTATDWYYNGVYQYGWYLNDTTHWRNENTRIYLYSAPSGTLSGTDILKTGNAMNLRSYNTLTLQGYFRFNNSSGYGRIILKDGSGNTLAYVDNESYKDIYTISLNISQLTSYNGLQIFGTHMGLGGQYITRIRVS